MNLLTTAIAYYSRLDPWARDLMTGVTTALLFSLFIYLEHWGLTSYILNAAAGLGALFLLLIVPKRTIVISGFFIGLLWFYWIGFSFEYYEMAWAIPLVSIGFGIIYALIFGLLALTHSVWLRALILVGLTFFAPFDFDWMRPELLFVQSFFGIETWQFVLILAALALTVELPKPWRYAAPLLLVGAMDVSTPHVETPTLDIKLVSTDVAQELKWRHAHQQRQIIANLDAIDQAIAEGRDIVILPESVFPLFMNNNPALIELLKQKSDAIAIITGALMRDAGEVYNVTYSFDRGNVQIAKKMVLVPFGEYIPLPEFLSSWINRVIFNGSSDYKSADRPTDFTIKGYTFRNAICYEATADELYEDDPDYIVAMSNNAWFLPSIQPTLQRLLMQYNARRHHSIIYHAANGAGTGIITP
jgi:apolipoprotein N-acyltransferase